MPDTLDAIAEGYSLTSAVRGDSGSDDAVVVRFEGEVDMAVADEFASHLQTGLDAASAHPARLLIIDLQAVTFFGSSAVNDVVACHDEGRSNGIAVAVVATSPIVVRVIHATGLDEILAVYPTIDDALAVSRAGE